MKQIVCMKWGTAYGPEFVNLLYGTAKNNITGDFRFVCLTDDTSGVRAEVECMPCPEIALEPPFNNHGWRKLALWADKLDNMEGSWLFLDLDVVITGSLDDFFTFKPDKTFVVMHNWTQPGTGIGNTSVFRFVVGSHPYLHDNIVKDFFTNYKTYRNEQTYISKTITDITYWPDEWCILFKTHCVPSWPSRFWREPVLPPTARVVAFPGDPNPDDALEGVWPPGKAIKKIYKHILPTRWIGEIWDAAD